MYYALKYWQDSGAIKYFVPFVAPDSFTDPAKHAEYGLNVNLYAKFLTYKQTFPAADIAVEVSDAVASVVFTVDQVPSGTTIEIFQTIGGLETSVLRTTTGTYSFTAGSTNRYFIRRITSATSFTLPVGSVWAYCCCITNLVGYTATLINAYLKYIFFYENTLTNIGLFQQSTITGTLYIPSGVTFLNPNTFSKTPITKVVTSDNLTTINGTNTSGAFYQCTSLVTAELGSGITSIGVDTFNGCTALQMIQLTALVPPTIVATTFRGIPAGAIFKVPAASLNAYKTATNWSVYASRIFAI